MDSPGCCSHPIAPPAVPRPRLIPKKVGNRSLGVLTPTNLANFRGSGTQASSLGSGMEEVPPICSSHGGRRCWSSEENVGRKNPLGFYLLSSLPLVLAAGLGILPREWHLQSPDAGIKPSPRKIFPFYFLSFFKNFFSLTLLLCWS